jgi:hypothetical protein
MWDRGARGRLARSSVHWLEARGVGRLAWAHLSVHERARRWVRRAVDSVS